MRLLLFISLPLLAGELFLPLSRFSPLYTPDSASVISPRGTYFAVSKPKGEFEVVELKTGFRQLQSEYVARTPPDLDHPNATHLFFTFSHDEKYLVADNYVFKDSVRNPQAHWVDVWEIRSHAIAGRVPPFFAAPSFRSLSNYYDRSPFYRYSQWTRIAFTPAGDELLVLDPAFRRFSFPGLVELNGEFDILGVDDDPLKPLKFTPVGAPLFLHSGSEALITVKGELFLFHAFPSSVQNYTRIGRKVGTHLETSGDGRWTASQGTVYKTGSPVSRAELPGPVYFSADGRRVLSEGVLYDAETGFTKLPSVFPGRGALFPSSTREHLFVRDTLERAFFVYSFSSGVLLQKISLGPNEFLLRQTDDGKLLIFKDGLSGRIRLFERR